MPLFPTTARMQFPSYAEPNMAQPPTTDQIEWELRQLEQYSMVPTSAPSAPTSNPVQSAVLADAFSRNLSVDMSLSSSPISPSETHAQLVSPSYPQMYHRAQLPKLQDFGFQNNWASQGAPLSVFTDMNGSLEELMSVYSESPSSLYSSEWNDYGGSVDPFSHSSHRHSLPTSQLVSVRSLGSSPSQQNFFPHRHPFRHSVPPQPSVLSGHRNYSQSSLATSTKAINSTNIAPPPTAIDTLMATLENGGPMSSASSSTGADSPTPPPPGLQSSPMTSSLSHRYGSTSLSPNADKTATQTTSNRKPKRHTCPLPDCGKAFSQPTHLKIHLRSHTGEKPYLCSVSSCGATFSQLGNLRTHERRHRGEKPRRRPKPAPTSSCDTSGSECGGLKRYECRLDSCRNFASSEDGTTGKVFTQLGNLKAHMNKFHKETLAKLSQLFAMEAMGLVDSATQFDTYNYSDHSEGGDAGSGMGSLGLGLTLKEEEELKVYFKSLYKNCNKGIKGRGKGRRVAVIV